VALALEICQGEGYGVHGLAASTRHPVVKCPKDYYTPEFVASLDNRAYDELDMQEEHDLGHILSRDD